MSDQAFQRVRVALQPSLPLESELRTKLILIDRSDTAGNRACENHEELKSQLEMKYQGVLDVVNFRGRDKAQKEVRMGRRKSSVWTRRRREKNHKNVVNINSSLY